MLLRYEVANYRSILDPVSLSLIAIDADRPSTWELTDSDQQFSRLLASMEPTCRGSPTSSSH